MDKIKDHIEKRKKREERLQKIKCFLVTAAITILLGYSFGMYLLYKVGILP